MATSRDGGPQNLASQLADPGFTPSVRTLGQLLELVAGEEEATAKAAERAVLRIEVQYASRVAKQTVTAAKAAARPARGRLTQLAGRLAHEARDPEGLALAWLLEAIADNDVKTRRAAARGLGNIRHSPEIEGALADAFDRSKDEADRRALAIALGKVGGEKARQRLIGSEHVRASVIVERETLRQTPAHIDPSRGTGGPLKVRFHTRSGLEEVLREELAAAAFGSTRLVAPGVLEGTLEGELSRALRIRGATHVGFPLSDLPKVSEEGDLADAIVTAISSPAALAIFRKFTATAAGAPIRFRLGIARGGHRRALVWRCAELMRARTPELINDPTDSTWEVVVDTTRVKPRLDIELVPRAFEDERFGYRRELVAASSHPTIATALVRVAPRRADDVVWDPFVGAGAELVERALIGPYARLIGTDVDARAVAAARANLARAGVARATVEEVDACKHSPEGVTVIITNPPMGRRVERGGHVDLLERFVSHAARVLVPGGALVWMVPEPKRILARAEQAGLRLDRAIAVDMGGFSAELSVYVKGAKRRA